MNIFKKIAYKLFGWDYVRVLWLHRYRVYRIKVINKHVFIIGPEGLMDVEDFSYIKFLTCSKDKYINK